MANAPKELLERIAAFGTIIKNAGLSAKEASKGFKLFNEAIKDAEPIAPANIWSERVLDEGLRDTYFSEYMQQPNIEVTNTYASTTHPEEIQAEDIDRAREEIKRIAIRQEEEITQELTESFEMLDPPAPDLSAANTCPHCMRHTTWSFRDYNQQAICNECQWEFNAWALENIEFSEMRTQVLELKLRQQEQQLEQVRNQQNLDRQLEQARETVAVEPTGPPLNMEVADEIRVLMAHRDLTTNQMIRLNELIGIVQNSPAPQLQSHTDEYAPELQRPLRGQGVSGGSVLQGNEESLIFFDESAEPWVDDREKEKPVKPLKPLKRKLDI